MNSTVTANGMQVKAQASSALVIAGPSLGSGVGTLTSITYNTSVTTLTPATHDDSFNTKLKYCANADKVDAATGYAIDGETLTFANAANTTDNTYYVDYVCYIAAAGGAMSNQDLSVRLTLPDAAAYNALGDTTRAISVDFYLKEDSTDLGTYKGTLNLTGLTSSTPYQSTTPVNLLENGTIPKNGSSSDYIQVTMRVYYDGNLEKSAVSGNTPAQAYVYSNQITLSEVNFGVLFTSSTNTTT